MSVHIYSRIGPREETKLCFLCGRPLTYPFFFWAHKEKVKPVCKSCATKLLESGEKVVGVVGASR